MGTPTRRARLRSADDNVRAGEGQCWVRGPGARPPANRQPSDRRARPTPGAWVAPGAVLPASQTTFSEAALALGARYCYRVLTVGALGDGDLNAPICGTPDKALRGRGEALAVNRLDICGQRFELP